MRYYSYHEYDPDEKDKIVTLSEEEILKEYYDYWYGAMCNKFGKEYVEANYSKEDCIMDWIIVNWAWSDEEGQKCD
jgi:hypothetical protein